MAVLDSQKLVILVGTNYQFQFMKKVSESELRRRNVCIPNIEGLKYFKGPNDISIVQIDDIYKKQDLQELIKAGVRKMILVGSEHTGCSVFLEILFYSMTQKLINSELHADIEVMNLNVVKSEISSEAAEFLGQTDSKSACESSKNLTLSLIDINAPPLSDEPWWKWENWNSKARKCQQLKFACFEVIELYTISYALLIKQEQKPAAEEDRRKRASLLTTVTKRLLKEICRPFYLKCNIDVESGELESYTYYALLTLNIIWLSVFINPLSTKPYKHLFQTIQIIRDTQDSRKCSATKYSTTNNNFLKKFAENLLNSRTARSNRWNENDFKPFLSIRTSFKVYDKHRKDFEDEANIDRLIKKGKILADILSEMASESLTRMKSKIREKSEITALVDRIESYQEIPMLLVEQPIRCAMESVEYNPNHVQATETLMESLSLFSDLVNEMYNLERKLKEREIKRNPSHVRAVESLMDSLTLKFGSIMK